MTGPAETVSLGDLERDPDPILATFRANEPVAYVPSMDMWLVTRWDDIQHVEDHPELFTAATQPSFLARTLGENMLTVDPPHHTRLKTAMVAAFQPGGTSGHFVKERLSAVCDGLIDDFVADGQADIMDTYATAVATISLQTVLGLDNITWQQLWGWCNGLITDLANFEDDPELKEIGDRAKHELGEALAEKIGQLEKAPDESALGHFLRMEQEGRINRDEIVNNVRLMISGGINEPRDGIGLATWALLADDVLRDQLEAEPRGWARFIEEVFRVFSPVGTVTRMATQDVAVGGVTIPKGSLVAGVLRSANLDADHWSEPGRIDLNRREGQHAAFALGVHRCIGEWLGRQEVRVGTRTLFERLPGLRLHSGHELTLHGFEFRGPGSLRVEWDRSVGGLR